MRRPRGGWNLLLVFVTTLVVGGGVRWWQLQGLLVQGWQDSEDYLTSSHAPWFSLDLWAGARAPAVPVLLKLVDGDGQKAMAVQVYLATLCWAALATVVASTLAAGWRRWVGAGLVVALSLSSRVTMWDQQILSECLALAFTALVVAAAIALSRRVTLGRAVALIAAAALWVTVRDAPATALLAGSFALAVVALVTRSVRQDILGVTAAGFLVIGVLTMVAANHGSRDDLPVEHVLAVRILPYPDRVRWFADHGMPAAAEIEALGPPIYPVPGGPPLIGVPEGPPFDEWHRWVDSEARSTFLFWMATHPDYVVTEPLREPERAYNNAEGDLSFYRSPDFRHVPLIGLLSAPTMWALPIILVAGAGLIWYDRLRSRLLLVGVIVGGTAVVHGLMAWHSDGMETARHLVVPGMQLRLALLLLVAALLGERTDDITRSPAAVGSVVGTNGHGPAAGPSEGSRGVPVTGAMGTATESAPAPIDPAVGPSTPGRVENENEPSRTEILDSTEA